MVSLQELVRKFQIAGFIHVGTSWSTGCGCEASLLMSDRREVVLIRGSVGLGCRTGAF